jgi:subtilase family serine protease
VVDYTGNKRKVHWLMKKNLFSAVLLGSGLFLILTTSATAAVMRMGGGLQPGFARPPLLLNLDPLDATSNYGPYSPAQVRHAYGVDLVLAAGATGKGQKIGIVDAYGDPSIQTDLNNFCGYYGIPSTTVQILGQPTSGNSGWALETALDVEWSHAIATNATIILSVAKSASTSDLLAAVDAAVAKGATVISMSWGAQESSGISAYDTHFQAPGVTFVASSGDSAELTGDQVEWPASSPYVVGVGGTTLYLNTSGTRIVPTGTASSETAWSDSGGGLSSVYGQPAYQLIWQSYNARGVPDVAYVADPNTGVGVAYGRYLYEVGGTSVGAPQWAALIALANSVRTSGAVQGDTSIYSVAGTAPTINPASFFDITSGSDGSDPDDSAGVGYDLVTGLGSPVAAGLVNALAPQTPDFSVSVTPSTQTVTPGSPVSYSITISSLNGFNGTVSLNAAGLPNDASSATPSPTSVNGSGSSSLTFSTSITGTYTITITGTSGSLTHTATVTLVVATPDFSLSASPASQTVRHGNSTSYTVSVSPSGGFTGTVALSAPGLPAGATATFSPTSINKSGSSTMTVRTSNGTPRQSYTLTITGNCTSPALTHTTTVTLTVN